MTIPYSSDKCRINEGTESFSFKSYIPLNINPDIKKAVRKTSSTGHEQSLTWCRVKNTKKIFTAAKSSGNENSIETMPCHIKHGDTEQIGDLHTHPTTDEHTIGLTPSTADYVSTVTDSYSKGIPQISCITGPGSKFINCYQPRGHVLNNEEKLRNYEQAVSYTESSITDISPYLKENVRKDFDHALYDRKTLKRVYNPTPKEIVKDSLMRSKNNLKRDVPDNMKPDFCKTIEDLNFPGNGLVARECLRQLS